MKKNLTLILAVAFISVLFVMIQTSSAQDTDILDVEPGFETLNLAIQGDTTATGEPANYNRIYRLERGEFYLLNGTIQGLQDVPLRIIATEGDGPKPVIVPAVSESGSAGNAFRPNADVDVSNLYVTGIDNLGNVAGKNMFRCDGDSAIIKIDNCFLDHEEQSFIRMNSNDQQLYLTNSTLRNTIRLAKTSNGRFIDTRGNTQESIFIQNCTMYIASHTPIRGDHGIIRNITMDHNTFYEIRGRFEIERMINGTITNNIFADYDYEGNDCDPANPNADSLTQSDLLKIEALESDLATDEERNIRVANNVYGWSPEIQEMFNRIDSVKATPVHNLTTLTFFDTYPNMICENSIEEYPTFSDAPDPAVVKTYAEYRITSDFSDENNPDPRADRNGIGALSENPTSFGPADDEFDFDYNTDAAAYTAAEGGFPAGDLNWFPDKKAEWEAWIQSGVANKSNLPREFALMNNYPNPFNPSTTIAYQLKSNLNVKLNVYNALGQHIRTLVNDVKQQSGQHKIQWNGLNDAGQQVASGVYFYRLEAGNNVQTMKMIMMK